MKVIQIRMKIFLLKDLGLDQAQRQVVLFLDKTLGQSECMRNFHEENCFKNYCVDYPYPHEADKIYKKDKIYTITIRTLNLELARFFTETGVNVYTDYIKALNAEVRVIPQKYIDTIYTLTPAILKCETGYWRDEMTLADFENRLKSNLIKKWGQYQNEQMDEDFQFHTRIEFLNKCPVSVAYKGVRLLGDKICLHIADNKRAQELAYMSLGTGVCEMNSRGFGFVNYRWL